MNPLKFDARLIFPLTKPKEAIISKNEFLEIEGWGENIYCEDGKGEIITV